MTVATVATITRDMSKTNRAPKHDPRTEAPFSVTGAAAIELAEALGLAVEQQTVRGSKPLTVADARAILARVPAIGPALFVVVGHHVMDLWMRG